MRGVPGRACRRAPAQAHLQQQLPLAQQAAVGGAGVDERPPRPVRLLHHRHRRSLAEAGFDDLGSYAAAEPWGWGEPGPRPEAWRPASINAPPPPIIAFPPSLEPPTSSSGCPTLPLKKERPSRRTNTPQARAPQHDSSAPYRAAAPGSAPLLPPMPRHTPPQSPWLPVAAAPGVVPGVTARPAAFSGVGVASCAAA